MSPIESKPSLARALATLAVLAASAQADVLVVDDDGGPGVGYLTIAAALSAATSGDLILVRDGEYVSFTTSDVSVSIVADAGATPVLSQGSFNTQSPLAGPCLLQGFEIASPAGSILPALETRGPNPVWVQSCSLAGGIPGGPFASLVTAFVIDGAHLFIDTDITGLGPGVDAISVAAQSTAYVYGGAVQGGHGNVDATPEGGNGVAIQTLIGQSKLAAYGTRIAGGDGADGNAEACEGQNGRAPLTATLSPFGGDNFEVLLVDSVLSGGAGGVGFGGCTDGQTGPAPGIGPANLNEQPGTARHLALTSPVRPHETVFATFTGDAGDLVFILKSFAQGPPIPIPGIVGPYHLGPLEFLGALGTIPAAGALQVDHTLGALAHVNGHLTAHYQALVIDTDGNASLSNPASVVYLAAGL